MPCRGAAAWPPPAGWHGPGCHPTGRSARDRDGPERRSRPRRWLRTSWRTRRSDRALCALVRRRHRREGSSSDGFLSQVAGPRSDPPNHREHAPARPAKRWPTVTWKRDLWPSIALLPDPDHGAHDRDPVRTPDPDLVRGGHAGGHLRAPVGDRRSQGVPGRRGRRSPKARPAASSGSSSTAESRFDWPCRASASRRS